MPTDKRPLELDDIYKTPVGDNRKNSSGRTERSRFSA